MKPIDEHLDALLEINKESLEEELGHARELKPIADKNHEVRERLNKIVTDDGDFKSKAEEVTNIISDLLAKVEQWESNN